MLEATELRPVVDSGACSTQATGNLNSPPKGAKHLLPFFFNIIFKIIIVHLPLTIYPCIIVSCHFLTHMCSIIIKDFTCCFTYADINLFFRENVPLTISYVSQHSAIKLNTKAYIQSSTKNRLVMPHFKLKYINSCFFSRYTIASLHFQAVSTRVRPILSPTGPLHSFRDKRYLCSQVAREGCGLLLGGRGRQGGVHPVPTCAGTIGKIFLNSTVPFRLASLPKITVPLFLQQLRSFGRG